jgi:hypothetical protein
VGLEELTHLLGSGSDWTAKKRTKHHAEGVAKALIVKHRVETANREREEQG